MVKLSCEAVWSWSLWKFHYWFNFITSNFYIFLILSLIWDMFWEYFLLFHKLLFHFVEVLAFQKLLFPVAPLVDFRFYFLCSSLCRIQKFIARDHVKETFPMFSSRSPMVSGVMLMSLTHFELIFVNSVR